MEKEQEIIQKIRELYRIYPMEKHSDDTIERFEFGRAYITGKMDGLAIALGKDLMDIITEIDEEDKK